MVLFNWGWSHLINKLSLIRSLKLFASEARISKWSKSIEELHSSRWSDTADCSTHLRRFPAKSKIPMCSAALLMLTICRKTLSVSYLLGLRLSHWFHLIRCFINSMMELHWVPHWDLRLSMFFFVIMKKVVPPKIALLNLNLLSIEATLMIHSYFST